MSDTGDATPRWFIHLYREAEKNEAGRSPAGLARVQKRRRNRRSIAAMRGWLTRRKNAEARK